MAKIGAFIRGLQSENHTKKGTLLLFPTGSFRFIHTHPTSRNPSSPPPETTRQNHLLVPRKHRNLGPNDVQDAEALLNRMTQMRPFPPISQINKALGCITRMGGLFKRGYTPDVVTFNTLINGLIIEDRTAEAVELFKKLVRNRDIEPNVVMYGAIVNGLCKIGNTIMAIRLLRIMEKASTKPDTVVYSTIIDSLCKDGMVDDAVRLLLEMKDRGKAKEADEVLEATIERGVDPDVVTYSSLMDGYDGLCKNGNIAKALSLFHTMESNGLDIDVVQYSILIDALCKDKKMDHARDLFKKLSSKGLYPNVKTYNIMIRGFCTQGLLDEAKEFFVEMEQNGCFPDGGTYNLIIQGFLAR
ncbi:hypothetical protein RHMOL_Rhmol04G0311000 [Rhododendron molle]|uniref:Uncharacterized protein n=1 Tax=Rhododendron molle TaxID=49168 RepID=A0ACC0P7B6_RHOML|nr:hypothetical protein RHMOL_Rhmol04G0311000 [Rhododendron molle]